MITQLLKLKVKKKELFLLEVLKHEKKINCAVLKELFEEFGSEQLYALTLHNKISSIAANALESCHILDESHMVWHQASAEMEARIKSYMAELDKIAVLLRSVDINLVALKNSGITRGLYQNYPSSPMGDIDVLVSPSKFRLAHELLINNGYELKFRSPLEEQNIHKAELGGGAEYLVKLPNDEALWFELQWRPVAGRWIRPDQEPSADELLSRAHAIEGSDVLLLSPEDNLLQVALHTAKHSFVRAPGFRLHTDVDRIVHSTNINWDIFVELVCKLQVKTPVYFSLALASDLLGTPIPPDVLIAIQPSWWKRKVIAMWLQRVGLFDPDGRKWSRLGYIFFVILLYDDFMGFVRSLIPSVSTLKKLYDEDRSLIVPLLYIKRIYDLIFKRTLVK